MEVVTGNKDLKFRVQGQMCDSITPVRVQLTHDIQVKLNEGTLKKYNKTEKKIKETNSGK